MATVAEIFQTMEYGPAPESDKESLSWLAKHERVFGHFIDGAWTEPGALFDVSNPATGKVIARVTNGTDADQRETQQGDGRAAVWHKSSLAG